MNTMHLADDQARMITIDVAGATVTRDDKRAFNEAIQKVGAEQNELAERTNMTPRAGELADKIADALRVTLAERGFDKATVTPRMFDPEEEAGYQEMATMVGDENADAAPDQARIGVEFVNGVEGPPTEAREILEGLASIIGNALGHRPIEQLPESILETGRQHNIAIMADLIDPGLRLFANDDWLAKAKAASPRGVQAAALGLMATILDYDYTAEVIAMNDRNGPASGLLRAKLVESGSACNNADFGALYSYLGGNGGEPEIVPWKDGAPVDTVNAAFAHGIVEGVEVVGIHGGTYKGLHETANDTGQFNRFRYHALASFSELADKKLVLRGLANVHGVIAWTGQHMDEIRAEAKRAETMAEEAMRSGTAPGDARVQ